LIKKYTYFFIPPYEKQKMSARIPMMYLSVAVWLHLSLATGTKMQIYPLLTQTQMGFTRAKALAHRDSLWFTALLDPLTVGHLFYFYQSLI
jgi:hypothetical protein